MFANKIHEKAHETLKSGEIEKAIGLYTKALEFSKDHPDIISDRAVAYLHNNNKELCYTDFEFALELEPNRAYRYSSFAFAMNHFGDIEGAIVKYQRAVELDPDDAEKAGAGGTTTPGKDKVASGKTGGRGVSTFAPISGGKCIRGGMSVGPGGAVVVPVFWVKGGSVAGGPVGVGSGGSFSSGWSPGSSSVSD